MKTMNDMELHGMCSNILHKVTSIDNHNTAVQITSLGAECCHLSRTQSYEHSNIVVSR